jgi:hypothetical protein
MIEQKLNEFITEILLHELIYNPLKNMKYDELLFARNNWFTMKITIAAGWSGLVTDGFALGTKGVF